MPIITQPLYLSRWQQILYTSLSFVIVAFGQPAWVNWLGLVSAAFGQAIFWRVLLSFKHSRERFWLSVAWFCCVQLVQLSWLPSHPFLYIYMIYFLITGLLGLQYGMIGLLIPTVEKGKGLPILGISALWVLLEWLRLFLLSGLSWNPIGMALSGHLISLQISSLWGVFGLSFWVMVTNLLALKAWIKNFSQKALTIWALAVMLPYTYGMIHLSLHTQSFNEHRKSEEDFKALLVQTAFPVEESMGFTSLQKMVPFVMDEWEQILKITKAYIGKPLDLIALPEMVVPFGTYSFVYPFEVVSEKFKKIYGDSALKAFPPLEYPFAERVQTGQGFRWLVNNAFWIQTLANHFSSPAVVGLEDAEDIAGRREYFSAAIYFKPLQSFPEIERYEKRVLVPMGEYIPFDFCRALAAEYGIFGSFTCGKEAKVMQTEKLPFGVSICYEETFGHLMRENKLKGAKMLVNLTSDVWFPNSRLPRQHADHARLRTTENGFPLLRACNTGITGAFDSFGRKVAILGNDQPESVEWVGDALYVEVPTYSYQTIYSKWGDNLIISLCALLAGFFALKNLFIKPNKS